MVQPAVRIGSAQAALAAARALETPSDVRRFEASAAESAAVRAFLDTSEWVAIRTRILGDGKLPLGRPESLLDLSRLFRWTADGAFSETQQDPAARAAYLHAATEIEAFDRAEARRIAPTSPAPARTEYVTGLGGAAVGVPQPSAEGRRVRYFGFSEALAAVKDGKHVTRHSWEPGTYVTAQAGYPEGIAINANTAAATGLDEGTPCAFPPYLMRCVGPRRVNGWTEPGVTLVPWTPDQADLFATDWCEAPRPGKRG